MKIAISSTGQDLDASVDPRFGRCGYFVFVDPETLEFEVEPNGGASASGGAGIAAAQQIAARKAEAVLTGNCGPNAFNVLAAAGINVLSGASGTIREAIQQYQSGALAAMNQANASPHSGMGGGGNRRA